ncbi:MAG: tyrosine-type recombinase/integrase [Gordonia sp. (in: high G+C Gram-positive bacteria)]
MKQRATEVAATAGRATSGAASTMLTPATPVQQLADKWMEQTRQSGTAAEQTLDDYQVYVDLVKIRLGELLVREVTPSSVEWLIEVEATGKPSKARNLRRTMRGMMALAIRHDAYTGANPATEVVVGKSNREGPRALTTDELQAYRARVLAWMQGADRPRDDDGQLVRRGGRQRSQDLLDIVDVQLATGARISEVLALRWSDVVLDVERPTAHICGTLVRLKGKTADGGGLIRQEHRKAKDKFTVFLPRFAVATLLRVKMSAAPNAYDVIFPSAAGTLRSPENLRTQLRAARGAEFVWVKPHSFRKTVATLVEREAGIAAAAGQLGNTEAVARKHYVEPSRQGPDVADVLEVLGPSQAAESPPFPHN